MVHLLHDTYFGSVSSPHRHRKKNKNTIVSSLLWRKPPSRLARAHLTAPNSQPSRRIRYLRRVVPSNVNYVVVQKPASRPHSSLGRRRILPSITLSVVRRLGLCNGRRPTGHARYPVRSVALRACSRSSVTAATALSLPASSRGYRSHPSVAIGGLPIALSRKRRQRIRLL